MTIITRNSTLTFHLGNVVTFPISTNVFIHMESHVLFAWGYIGDIGQNSPGD